MQHPNQRIAGGVLDAIGGTPHIRLKRFLDMNEAELLVKLESANPGGSVKDRPAKMMLEDAIAYGRVSPGSTVIESSSGNMGIGLAQACRYHDLRFTVGAYCTESELLSLRRLHFPSRIQRGDLVVFPNTAGYLMHFLESRSHQFSLAHNVVVDGDWGTVHLDAID